MKACGVHRWQVLQPFALPELQLEGTRIKARIPFVQLKENLRDSVGGYEESSLCHNESDLYVAEALGQVVFVRRKGSLNVSERKVEDLGFQHADLRHVGGAACPEVEELFADDVTCVSERDFGGAD